MSERGELFGEELTRASLDVADAETGQAPEVIGEAEVSALFESAAAEEQLAPAEAEAPFWPAQSAADAEPTAPDVDLFSEDAAEQRERDVAAAPPAEPVAAASLLSGMKVRDPRARRRRVIWASVSAAVILVIGAVAVAGVLAKQSMDAAIEDAMAQLADDEHALMDRINEVNGDIEALERDVTTATTNATALAQPLASMAGVSEESARALAETARLAYAGQIAEVEAPDELRPYQRAEFDAPSLEQIEAAREEVADQSRTVSTVSAEVASARGALAEAGTDLTAAMTAFRATIPAFAETVIEQNLDADLAFQDSVRQTAATFAATQVLSENRAAVWNAYISAVGALRADQQRAEREAAEAEEEEEWGSGGDGGGGSEEPVVPVPPAPPLTDPPVIPEPDPTIDPVA